MDASGLEDAQAKDTQGANSHLAYTVRVIHNHNHETRAHSHSS